MALSEKEREVVREIMELVARMPIQDVLDDLDLLEPETVKDKLKIGLSTVYHLAHEGRLPGSKIGAAVRFRPRALLAFILAKEKLAMGVAA